MSIFVVVPFTVHWCYFFPRFHGRVEFPTRVKVLEPVESTDDVNVLIHNDCAMIGPRPIRVFLEYARPTIRLCVVRFDDGGRAAATPTTDGK